jgi:hypothetical protein
VGKKKPTGAATPSFGSLLSFARETIEMSNHGFKGAALGREAQPWIQSSGFGGETSSLNKFCIK